MTLPVRPLLALAGVLLCAGLAQTSSAASPAQQYMLYCMGCHGVHGRGVAGKVPPLTSLGRFMRSASGRNYVLRVPGAASSALSDADLAAVLNWAAHTFDDAAQASAPKPFTVEEVSRARHHPLDAVLEARRAVVRELAESGAAPPAEY